MKRNFFLILLLSFIFEASQGQNIVNAQDYLNSECLKNVDSILVDISSRDLRKKAEEILIIKVTDSLRAKTLRLVENKKFKEVQNNLEAMKCLIAEKGSKVQSSKKKRELFLSYYREVVFAYTEYTLKKEKISPLDYVFLYELQNTGTEFDDLIVSRELTIRFLNLYKRNNNYYSGGSYGDEKSLIAVQKGIIMLIEIYERGLDKRYALRDFENAMDILMNYIPQEYQAIEARKWKRTIGERAKIYLQ